MVHKMLQTKESAVSQTVGDRSTTQHLWGTHSVKVSELFLPARDEKITFLLIYSLVIDEGILLFALILIDPFSLILLLLILTFSFPFIIADAASPLKSEKSCVGDITIAATTSAAFIIVVGIAFGFVGYKLGYKIRRENNLKTVKIEINDDSTNNGRDREG